MNKKGALFYWMFFATLIALAVFFTASDVGLIQPSPKGEWSLNFLTNNYLPAQQEILKINIVARDATIEVAKKLATQGGFAQESPCGQVAGANLWNTKGRWCNPNITTTLRDSINAALQETSPNQANVFKVNYDGQMVYGRGKSKTITTQTDFKSSYTFDSNFAVNIGYSFDDYFFIEEDAQIIVSKCSSSADLRTCLDNQKVSNWKYGDCQNQKFTETERKVLFCVESPLGSKLKYGKGYGDVNYRLALDFSPDGALQFENVAVSRTEANPEKVLVEFAQVEESQSYTIYYTSWDVSANSGTPSEVFGEVPKTEDFAIFETITINSIQNCVEEKVSNQAYSCEGSVQYIVEDSRITDKPVYVAVTSTKEGKESKIASVSSIESVDNVS